MLVFDAVVRSRLIAVDGKDRRTIFEVVVRCPFVAEEPVGEDCEAVMLAWRAGDCSVGVGDWAHGEAVLINVAHDVGEAWRIVPNEKIR